MRLGFHISIAGGFSKVVTRAQKLGCETIQFFSRSPRSWSQCAATEEEIDAFRMDLENSNINPLFLHAPYVLNLATSEDYLYSRSIAYLSDELLQAQRLGAHCVIIHAGNRKTSSEDTACRRVSEGITRALKRVASPVKILIENTAGQGTEIGLTFPQLEKILNLIQEPNRVGICLDTAHAFAAGYDLSTTSSLEKLGEELDATIGLDRIGVIHLNDTLALCGSKVDRHWHIGKGKIGRSGFRNIINYEPLNNIPGIIETPRKNHTDDIRNMRVLRRLQSQTT